MSARTIRFLMEHPLAKRNKPLAYYRFFSWQVRSRLSSSPVVYDFVNNSQLLVYPRMTGATGNVYAGLHEFYDMSFVLHALRSEDLFVDIGANIGSYTTLAGAAVGANCISIEPIPATFAHLLENVELNNLQHKVECLNIGLGKEPGELKFSSDEDTMNHVVSSEEFCEKFVSVKVKSLDDILGVKQPTIIKIDVEGWEESVISGAEATLSKAAPLAVLMEFGLGERYGFNERALYQKMIDFGFERASYAPFARRLIPYQGKNILEGNILFVKQMDFFQMRVQSAPKYKALNVSI